MLKRLREQEVARPVLDADAAGATDRGWSTVTILRPIIKGLAGGDSPTHHTSSTSLTPRLYCPQRHMGYRMGHKGSSSFVMRRTRAERSAWVIIENQLERTDHTHLILRQVLYLAPKEVSKHTVDLTIS